MKALYLLRHAKSSWDDPGLSDFDRPLAKRGRRACALMTAHLRDRNVAPDLVLCSTAKRARQTLEGVREALPATTGIAYEDGLYLISARDIMARLGRLDDDVGAAMLIAHNPGMHDFGVLLAGKGDWRALAALAGKYPTAGFLELELAIDRWSEITAGSGTLIRFTRPRSLER